MRIALPPAISAAALAGRDPAAPVADLAGETMGTTWRVLFARPRGVDPAAVRRAIELRLAGLVGEMSHWEAASLLSRFNRLAAGSWMTLPPDFAHVVAAALQVAAESDGAFDPTLGRPVNLAGFGPAFADPAPARAMAEAGWRRLDYDRAARRLRQPGGLWLDLSGIAKGYAVDAVADLLGTHGIAHCLVEIGGELVGRGVRPDGDPWWVDLEDPPGATLAPLRIALHGIAVATTGNYRRGAHTLDPATGTSTDNAVIAVSVIHADAMHADAWATVLAVLGAEAGVALATRHGIAARIVEWPPREHLTPALEAMLAD